MPIGNVPKEPAGKRDNYRPPWVKNKDAEAPPPWTQRKLKPVEGAAKAAGEEEGPAVKPVLKPALKKQATIKDPKPEKEKTENGSEEPVVEENLLKPSAAKQADKAARSADEKPRFTKSTLNKTANKAKAEEISNDKTPEKPTLRSVKILDEKKNSVTEVNSNDKAPERPKFRSVKTIDKNAKAEENSNDKNPERPKLRSVKTIERKDQSDENSNKLPERPTLRKVKTIDDKPKEKTVTIAEEPKFSDRNSTSKTNSTANGKPVVEKKVNSIKDSKLIEKPKVESKKEENAEEKMATKPPTPLEKTPSKLPPRKPSMQKQLSKDEPVKKWRDPLHERVKDNIDKTLANEIPKGHTLTKNESLRSLLKPAPPPMPPPLPPKMPPPPEFKKAPLDPNKLKKIESLRSRPRRRPDWSDMMKEVEEGKKLKKVVCNDRSSPVITRSTVVKNKDQFIFESEKPNVHNDLLKEINKGVRLKKTKTNDRSKPILEGLRKFRRQMTIEEQVQKSMSQANLLASSPSGASVSEMSGVGGMPGIPAAMTEEEEIDEMDDIDKVRDDLQSTKQLLAIELRNKEAQERENKRLLTKIQNLEAELARERAFARQEQHKTVISVTDAYDERLVNSLKLEADRAKQTADHLEKQYLDAAEARDDALTELEEVKRKNAELEKKLEQALSSVVEELCIQEEPMSFFQKRQLDFEKQCRLLNIDVNSAEANELKKANNANASVNNNNYSIAKSAASTNWNYGYEEGIIPTNTGSRRSSHAIKQLSVTKDNSFEEEEESEPEEEESEEKKQKRMEKDIRNMRAKISHLKQKQDNMKQERMGYKMALKNNQAALKDEKRKYKELKREVDKMAAMMKECGSDDEDEDEDEEESESSKSESEEEETETETEQDTESETESESEPEDAPMPKKKDNLTTRLKRHEARVNALKKGNALLMANVDRLKDDVLKQKEESCSLKKELDSLIEDLE